MAPKSRTTKARKSISQRFPNASVVESTPGVSCDGEPKNAASATPTSQRQIEATPAAAFVTPSTGTASTANSNKEDTGKPVRARRTLFPTPSATALDVSVGLVTPLPRKKRKTPPPVAKPLNHSDETALVQPSAKRRLIFGKYVDLIESPPNVEKVYKIVKKLTGSVGGNGYVGPIYGELTMGSMQKMTNLMMEHCGLDKNSRFIDVGSGIGKPNLHVAQHPGVEFSCGVEMEHSRWTLGMACLKGVLDAAKQQQQQQQRSIAVLSDSERIQANTVFLYANITEAKSFDPFTHVYMFSIGFPPPLWLELSDMWNRSSSSVQYLICYHGPKNIIREYEFNVELVTQTSTSMHGSKEGHMGYIYRRVNKKSTKGSGSSAKKEPCDALFRPSWDLVRRPPLEEGSLYDDVTKQVEQIMGSGRKTRSSSTNRSHSR